MAHPSGTAIAVLTSIAAVTALRPCPTGFSIVQSSFEADGQEWTACEDLQHPGGAIALVPTKGDLVWLPKTYEPYSQGPDSDYYLGLDKETVLGAKWDMLGTKILEGCSPDDRYKDYCEPTWAKVERAVPVMRYSGGNKEARAGSRQEWMCSPYSVESGVRTFVGSRSASVDATFSDHADDCTDNGFPRPQSYVMNLTAIADGEPAIIDFINYVNFSGMADGLVGGVQPNVIFYFPILKQNFSGFTGSRYWTMIANPVADMQGGREQSVWFRFQQLVCKGEHFEPPCQLHGAPQYYDTYWYSNNPITKRWIPPEKMGNASGFYSNLLAGTAFWKRTLFDEGMMQLDLPETAENNGTWLVDQAVHGIVRSMISRDDTWHPRYGVIPGYGITLQDGFEDTFTANAYAALEIGAIPYARGIIDNWLRYYVRDNGMTTYRAEELAQSGRMLTIFSHYVDYTGDDRLMIEHFDKAKALAEWLIYRWNQSLEYPHDDPRYGIPPGGDEGDGFIGYFEGFGSMELEHKYSCAGNIYRGFDDIGRMWTRVGAKVGRADMVVHGNELLSIAPKLRSAIQSSINKTSFATGNPVAPRCVLPGANSNIDPSHTCTNGDFRAYPELLYSGVLTYQQVDDIYKTLSKSNNSGYPTRPLTMGCVGYNNKQTTYTAYGFPFGLLQHDMIERFLLHYFAMSAHTYTRGTWTTPEAVHPDRDVASTDFVAAGVVTATTYLKWMLVYEEPDSRTVWVAKAVPRDWLEPGQTPVVVNQATTRYGRISFRLQASSTTVSSGSSLYTITANVTLPSSFVTRTPTGGLVLRFRTPLRFAGKLNVVTVGGKVYRNIDSTAETVSFPAHMITTDFLHDAQHIVAKFA